MNARNARMVREVTVSDGALAAIVSAVLVLVVVMVASPSRFAPVQLHQTY